MKTLAAARKNDIDESDESSCLEEPGNKQGTNDQNDQKPVVTSTQKARQSTIVNGEENGLDMDAENIYSHNKGNPNSKRNDEDEANQKCLLGQ